jgi:hypothetical protein
LGLSDVAGIFSRKFVVGFFLPGFFGTVALKLLVNHHAVPPAIRNESGGTQILIVGGIALLLGLLLWGLHYPLIRFFEGYWLVEPVRQPRSPPWSDADENHKVRATWRKLWSGLAGWLSGKRLAYGTGRKERWQRDRQRLVELKGQPEPSPERTQAARALSERYPVWPDLVLPTELGNVIRAFETHPRDRYNLEGIAIWPRITSLLSEQERAELDDVSTDIAFWLNGLTVVLIGGLLLFAERLWHRPGGWLATVLVEIAILTVVAVLAVWMYREAISAAIRWGEPVRAAFDMHRFELFERLGLRSPGSKDEDIEFGTAVNRMLAFGVPLPDAVRAAPTFDKEAAQRGDV